MAHFAFTCAGAYFCMNMVLITLSTFIAVVIIQTHIRGDRKNKVPPWLKRVRSQPLYTSLCPSVSLSVCLSVRKKRTGSCVHKDRKIMPPASEAMLRSVRLSVRLFVPCPLIKNGTFYGKNTNRKLHTGSRIHWSAWPWKWPKWPRHIVSAPSTRHLCLYVDFSSFLTVD